MSLAFIENHWYLVARARRFGRACWSGRSSQRRLSPVKDIGNLEATRLINSANALLVDVRETKEFEGGRLPKAVHIPLSQLASRGDELARHAGRPVVAYCMTRQPQQRGRQGAGARRASRTSTSCTAATGPGRTRGCPVEK